MEDRDQVDVEWWENITKCDKISKITDVETIDPIVNVKICDDLSHFKVAELTSGSVDAAVLPGTALDLSYIKDGEVDLVVTDPPYYSNIQYGELSDFYYVWLRLFLRERYPHAFGLEPEQLKPQEIVVNPKKGKDEKFFVEMLTAALREAYRVLRKDGILAMTYHHSEEESWADVAYAIMESGFQIVAMYPARSEHRGRREKVTLYDYVIVATKGESKSPQSRSWGSLKSEVVSAVMKKLAFIQGRHPLARRSDAFTVAMGEALRVLGKHYPHIEAPETLFGGLLKFVEKSTRLISDLSPAERLEAVKITLKEVWRTVESLVPVTSLPDIPDPSERLYLILLQYTDLKTGPVEYDAVLPFARWSATGLSDLEQRQLLVVEGRRYRLASPEEYGKAIVTGEKPLKGYVDAAYAIKYALSTGLSLRDLKGKLAKLGIDLTKLSSTLKFLATILDDETYFRAAKIIGS
jgi:hypothetical protein